MGGWVLTPALSRSVFVGALLAGGSAVLGEPVLVVLAAPFVVLLGVPVLGYVVGAVAWIVQRFAAVAIERRAARSEDVKTALGLNMASLVLRAWLIGLTILAVGMIADREDGLVAGITVLVAFTVYFAISLILRPLERKPSRP
jgi:hypothetical protein